MNLKKRFLFNSDDTGRFIVRSLSTGRTYFVEAIDDGSRTHWGDLDPATKKFHGDYGTRYKGSVKPDESLITVGNGFDAIHELSAGESPFDFIDALDKQYGKGKQ
ncbi:MAG: hypothetical protein J6Y37_00055 [Paludibacteraceae bacterium]|nr:hypothetical protein [Paludibacteraceae bacterium]